MVDLVSAIRSVRAEMNIAAPTPLVLVDASAETARARDALGGLPQARRARVRDVLRGRRAPGSVQLVVRGEVAALPLKGIIDVAAEQARLTKEIAKADADIKRVDAKLGNADFVASARRKRSSTARRKSARRPKAAAPRSWKRWSG